MSSVQCFAASSTSYSFLPAELKAEIVRNFDLPTALAMMRCGKIENDVVRRFGRFTIGIVVTHPTSKTIVIELQSKPDNLVAQKWEIKKKGKKSKVRQMDGSNRLINKKSHKVPMKIMAFSIVGRLISDEMFDVMKLEFALSDYKYPVDLNLKKMVEVKLLVMTRCTVFATYCILNNKLIKPKAWFVTSDCSNILKYTESKLQEMYENELANMVTGRRSLNEIVFCRFTQLHKFIRELANL